MIEDMVGLLNAEQVGDDDKKADCTQSLVKAEDGRFESLSHSTRAKLGWEAQCAIPHATPCSESVALW